MSGAATDVRQPGWITSALAGSLAGPSIRLVIFDCDGVLIDSEAVASRVVAERLTRDGWPITASEAQHRFMGMTLTDMAPVIEAKLGMVLNAEWRAGLAADMVAAMRAEAILVNGATAAMDAAEALGLPWRVASNSSHGELAAKFSRTGLTPRMAGRVHSHQDVARGKPAPDLFLAAARAQGVDPGRCLVIEDSAVGVTAARAAGMRCVRYVPDGNRGELQPAGTVVFTSMHDIPELLAAMIDKADA